MFGMGFTEIMLIAIIAVIFLGPDKLPETLVNIAKFFRSFKSTIADAKSSLEQEINISDLKKEALGFKNELSATTKEIDRIKDMANLDLPLLDDYKPGISPIPTQDKKEKSQKRLDDDLQDELADKEIKAEETVTFKKKKKTTDEELTKEDDK